MSQLTAPHYLAFPFEIGAGGPKASGRSQHVREQIEQVLFTSPGERVFRADFGAGIRSLVFEPNTSALWDVTRKRLIASLAEALTGEVDPRTIEVELRGSEETLTVVIRYALATLGHTESHQVLLGSGVDTMAELSPPQLVFKGTGACPDCGERRIELPAPLPDVGDDFDWRAREYDGLRRSMLEELAARFPERSRWTPADLEVVLVEVLAAVLDQLSDTLDRVAAERFLETARRPGSVRRLLGLVGYDAVALARARGQIAPAPEEGPADGAVELEAFWRRNPHFMEEARRDGPRAIHTQRRMVTLDDYAARLEDHPLVLRAHARSRWTGAWTTVRVAVVGWESRLLDVAQSYPDELRDAIAKFHEERAIRLPGLEAPATIRTVLRPYLDVYRPLGQEVVLEDAALVGVSLAISIRVADNFYQSEVRRAAHQALGTTPGGFFEHGRLAFGEDLHASDVVQVLMALDGVESVCLNRFKRLGSEFPDQAASGRIPLDGLELAVCDSDPAQPGRGYYRVALHGGLKG